MYLTIEEIDHLLIFIHDYSEGCKVCRKTKEKLEDAKKIHNWNIKKWANNQIPTALPKSAEQLLEDYTNLRKVGR